MSDATAERTARTLIRFRDVLEAATPAAARRDTLDLRIRAKLAQSEILTRATFNQDEADAAWAQNRARIEIARCENLLLDS